MDIQNEIWKPIPGFEGLYEASSLGRVRNASYLQIIKGKPCPKNYWNLTLYKEGKPRYVRRCRAVAMAFLQNPHNKPEVNHKNLHHDDDTVNNLEWVTKAENSKHWVQTSGHHHHGHTNSRLSPVDLAQAKTFRHQGWKWRELAEKFHMSIRCIRAAVVGQSYSDSLKPYIPTGMPKGEGCHLAKLIADDVMQIKKMLRDRQPRWLIARIFGVSIFNVNAIAQGKTWTHVDLNKAA